MKRKIILIILTLVLAVAGVYLDMANINVGEGIDKVYHFIAFFTATLWLAFLLLNFFPEKYFNSLLVASVVLGGAFAAFTEKLQELTPNRSDDPLDWLANVAGIMLAGAVAYILFIKFNNKANED